MFVWIVVSLAFLGAFLAIIAINSAVAELASGEQRRLNEELKLKLQDQVRKKLYSVDYDALGGIGERPKSSLSAALGRLIDQSGQNITPQTVGMRALLCAIAAAAAGFALTQNILMAVPFAVAAGMIPLLLLKRAGDQRRKKLGDQLADTFETMSRVLRSGQTISQAMQVIAEQGSPPISVEFYRCHEQMNLGMTPEAAMHELADRTGLLDIKVFTVAVLVQRQTGGNLSEIFDKMSHVVRERQRIRGMIHSLTAQGRMQAAILTALPLMSFALLMALKPEYEMQILNTPSLVLSAIGLMSVGSIWIQRVVNFDF